MGTNVSKQTNKSITDIVNKSISSIKTDVSNSSRSQSSTYQNITINLSNVISDRLKVEQVSDSTTKALLNSDSKLMAELSANVSNKIADDLSATLAQTNEDFNMLQTNVGIIEQDVRKNIETNMQQMIQTGISNASVAITQTKQGMVLNVVDSTIGNIILDQHSITKNISESIAKTVSESTASVVIDNDASTKMVSDIAQLNKGLDLMGFLMMMAMGGIILVGGLGFYSVSRAMNTVDDNAEKALDVAGADAAGADVAGADAAGADAAGGYYKDLPDDTMGGERRGERRGERKLQRQPGRKNIYEENTESFFTTQNNIIIVVILLVIQYIIHKQWLELKNSPITGKMANPDPPNTIFKYVGGFLNMQ
jgi:hypothetical protein